MEIIVESGVGWSSLRAAVQRATAADVIVVRTLQEAVLGRALAANRGVVRTFVVRAKEVGVGKLND